MDFLAALGIAVFAGLCNSMQGSTNTALSTRVGRAQATFVSFAGGTILLGVMVLLFGQGDLSGITRVPAWQLITGCYGFLVIVSVVYSTPRLGIAFTLMILMFSKLLTGAIIDTFGLVTATPHDLSAMRVVGLAVVAAGILLVTKDRMDRAATATGYATGGNAVLAAVLVAIAGAGNAIQAPTLAALSATTGSMEASLWNFIVGLACATVFILVSQKGKWQPFRGAGTHPWQYLGGIYGTAIVLIVITVTPILGVGLLVSAQMAGQLTGGMLIDSRGWLGCKKIPVTPKRIGGVLLVAAGVLVISLLA